LWVGAVDGEEEGLPNILIGQFRGRY
jgi:hypothetical protein